MGVVSMKQLLESMMDFYALDRYKKTLLPIKGRELSFVIPPNFMYFYISCALYRALPLRLLHSPAGLGNALR